MTTRIVSLLVICLVCGSPALAAVDRIDPPNWWVGMEENSVQLMLYGRGIGGGNVGSRSPDVTITEVVSGDSANYLFVTLPKIFLFVFQCFVENIVLNRELVHF